MGHCDPYCFTQHDRNILTDHLSRFDGDRVIYFLNECERVIGIWKYEWGSNHSIDHVNPSELKSVATKSFELAGEIQHMGTATSEIFWNLWRFRQGGKEASFRDNWEMIEALREIGDSAQALVDSMSQKGGPRKLVESDFIQEIADVYRKAFNRRPSATPTGIFGSIVLTMADIVKMPDEKEMVIGRDLLRSSIENCKASWDYEDQLIVLSKHPK